MSIFHIINLEFMDTGILDFFLIKQSSISYIFKMRTSLQLYRVGKMCVAAMSLCMIVLIVSRTKGDGRYYFAL
jgi:hypothetical protein